MIAQQALDAAKTMDLVELAGKYSKLERVAAHEFAGPCPKCGGTDRLHVTPEWWFCRQCSPKRGDAVGFVRWQMGLSFADAVSYLNGNQFQGEAPVRLSPRSKTRPAQRDAWQNEAGALLARGQYDLWRGDGQRGREYLERRGLTPDVWQAFGLGYATHFNRDAGSELPAIMMPWYRAGKLTAIRFRFLAPPGKQKITSLKDSQFAGLLFGGQALEFGPDDGAALKLRTLMLCEGEINAMSLYGASRRTALDVLSWGSESTTVTEPMVAFAKAYARVIVWMDKPEIMHTILERIPGAYGLSSPAGQDANDMLRSGKLGEFVAAMRWKATNSNEERERLLWDLWDAANSIQGVDAGTARAIMYVAKQLGKPRKLVEAEVGRWVTA